MDLKGLRILNTRPKQQAKELEQAISQAGGISIACPAIEITESEYVWLPILSQLNWLAQLDYAIFISTNAVVYFFAGLKQQAKDWPATIQVLALGEATQKALREAGIQDCLLPAVSDSEHLLQLPDLQAVKDKKIGLIKGQGGRTLLEETLKTRGALVYTLEVYQRCLPERNIPYINSLWQNDAVDIILFTSTEAIDNLFTLFGAAGKAWLCSKPCLMISERLARHGKALGIKTILVSPPDKLLNALGDYKKD